MFLFKKTETTDDKIHEIEVPETNNMERGEDTPLVKSEITTDVNQIDYDTEDEFDEDIDEYDKMFNTILPVIETVSSLKVETPVNPRSFTLERGSCPFEAGSCSPDACSCGPNPDSTDEAQIKVEIVIEASFISRLCKLLSKLFTRAQK